MGRLRDYAKVMDEAPKLEKDYGLSYHAAIRKAKEMILDKKKVAPVPASERNNHTKTINNIIPPGVDIDNGEFYFEKNGQTFKDLI